MANPLKRAHNEAADGCDTSGIIKLSECTRHSDLWFDDGSIVLCAEKTLFRVHRTTLCTHSKIFSDVFSLPKPLGEHTIEGCPVVFLPDKAYDFENLLKAVYNPLFRPKLMSAEKLEGILRLSTKYEMPAFRKECISYLVRLFPSKLHDFDNANKAWPFIDAPGTPTCFWAATMAREVNIPEIIPCAMYLCSQMPVQHIILGDGMKRLSQEDQNMCWEARERLAAMARSRTYGFLHEFSCHGWCQQKDTCKNGARRNLRAFHADGSGGTYARVESPLSIETFSRYEDNVCSQCLGRMKIYHGAGRQAVWYALPSLFGFDSWEEIFLPDPAESLSE